MTTHTHPSRFRIALGVASLALAACALMPRGLGAQETTPPATSPTTSGAWNVATPGSRLGGLLNAGAVAGADGPFARFTEAPDAMRDSIVALARAQIGRRYRRGGTSPDRGFDCSGLVKYVLGLLDVAMPRTAKLQAREGEAIPKTRDDLKPGDLLTFGRSAQGASHVAIYVGDGHYVHASVTAGHVIESSLDRRSSSLVRAWRGVRRLFDAPADSDATVPADTATRKGDG